MKTGQWKIFAKETVPAGLDEQVSELLSRLSSDIDVWREISDRFRVDLFCGWFMHRSNEGASVSPSSMKALGERGIELSLDIYAPDDGV